MKQTEYHGIVFDQEFIDTNFPETLTAFAKKKDGKWLIYGIKVDNSVLEDTITSIQANMKTDTPYYAHLYNDEELIVIFKDRVFKVTSDISSWQDIIDYGRELNIPGAQLDFWPNRFQDERHYFPKD